MKEGKAQGMRKQSTFPHERAVAGGAAAGKGGHHTQVAEAGITFQPR